MGSPEQTDLEVFLADRDAACPVCAYNLRALKSDRCPECGRQLVLTVGTTEPRLGAFILGIVGMAAGLGFCGIVFAWAMYLVSTGSRGPMQSEVLMLMAGTVANGLGVWAWIGNRRRIGKMTDTNRWGLAFGCVLFGLMFPAWLILNVR